MSSPSPNAHRTRSLLPRLSRNAWLLIGGAVGIGVVLFLLLLRDLRTGEDFYRANPAADSAQTGSRFEALPAPIAGEPATGQDAAPIPPDARVIGVDDLPPPPEPAPLPAPQAQTPAGSVASGTQPPQPIDQTQPDYPMEALRNGESGTVLLRVTVGPDGFPYGIAIARSSRSRALDRAAMTAARRWRFSPALRNGQPTSQTVEIPVVFNLPN